jgi:hypothetical protein
MNGTQKEYEEQTIISSVASWIILIVFPIIILSWGMFVKMIVATGPAHWDFGILPDTPSQSIYSTAEPPKNVRMPTFYSIPQQPGIPYQIQRIPDAQLPPGEIKQ